MSSVRESAYQDYIAGEQLKAIADKYGISGATVRSWKRRHWDADNVSVTQRNTDAVAAQRNAEPLQSAVAKGAKQRPRGAAEIRVNNVMRRSVSDNDELTESQKDFCLYYMRNRNATQAYLKSHNCSYDTARSAGSEALTKPKIRDELARLREIKNASLGMLTGEDIVEQYMRIAFADMGDFADWHSGITLKSSDEIDGNLVTEVSETQNGVKIKLADKMKALAWLAEYFGLIPKERDRNEDEALSLAAAIDGAWKKRKNNAGD